MEDNDEKLVAFRNILIGKVKEFVDIHGQNLDYEDTRKLAMEWAMKKRVDGIKTTTHSGMDLNLAMKMAEDWIKEEMYNFTNIKNYEIKPDEAWKKIKLK